MRIGNTIQDRTLYAIRICCGQSGINSDMLYWDEGSNPSDQATLNLPAASDVSVYDPLAGTSAQQTFSGTTSATIHVGTDPLIVRVAPSGSAAPTASGQASIPTPSSTTSATPGSIAATSSTTATTTPSPTSTPASQPPAPASSPSAGDTGSAVPVTVGLAEDAWRGDAIASIAIDGTTLGQPTVTALQSSGDYQSFSTDPQLAPGEHKLTVHFLNDAYGGTPSQDRNLYVDHIKIDGYKFSGRLPFELRMLHGME